MRMVVEEDRRSMEEGLIQQRHQNDRDDPRVTTCVILSTFVAVCSSFSFGSAVSFCLYLISIIIFTNNFLSANQI